MTQNTKDHGGGLDAARKIYGGSRIEWIDLSTGINPVPYPTVRLGADDWSALPDTKALDTLYAVARDAWQVPCEADIVAAPGASALIAQIPQLCTAGTVHIPGPTYNEHAAAFDMHGWREAVADRAEARVIVHPNNPTGQIWSADALYTSDTRLTVVDESFCDVTPEATLMPDVTRKGTVILKSFGKFWGLAGLRLGFAIGDPDCIAQLRARLGPWAVSGPALTIGAAALADTDWADTTRARLARDSARLDLMMRQAGAEVVGGTTLFRLYNVDDARAWQDRLARFHIWSRVFPYSQTWLRLGLPHPLHWSRVETALA